MKADTFSAVQSILFFVDLITRRIWTGKGRVWFLSLALRFGVWQSKQYCARQEAESFGLRIAGLEGVDERKNALFVNFWMKRYAVKEGEFLGVKLVGMKTGKGRSQ